MKKTNTILLRIAAAACLCIPAAAFAQSSGDDSVLAYHESANNADDEILAAMKALDEVNALLEEEKSQNITIDDLINAASSSDKKDAELENRRAKLAAAAARPDNGRFRVDDVLNKPAQIEELNTQDDSAAKNIKDDTQKIPAPSKYDIQTAGTKIAAENIKKDTQKIPAPSKYDIQTAGTKIAAENVGNSTPKASVRDKFDIQTAPGKARNTKKPAYAASSLKNIVKSAENNKTAQKSHDTAAQNTKTVKNAAAQTTSMALAYVSEVYKLNGIDIAQKIQSSHPTIGEVYQYAFKNKNIYQTKRPAVGDLAFFHNSYDRNRDGRWNDWHSLVGIVESVDDNDTITVLIYTSKIEKVKLNLKYPQLKKRKGQIINSQLRADEGGQVGTTAKLFAGFANILGDIPSVTVIDNWKPGMKFE